MWRIRKRIAETLYLEDYLKRDQISQALYNRLILLIRRNANILIVAPQGAGKTTLANAILNTTYQIYPGTRFAILEDTPEIQCVAPNRYEMLTCDRLGYNFARLIPMQLRYGAHSITMGEVRAAAHSLIEVWGTGTTRTGVATTHGINEIEGAHRIREILVKERFEISPHTIRKAIQGFVVIKPVEDDLPRITNVTWIKDIQGDEFVFEPLPKVENMRRARPLPSSQPAKKAS